MYAIYYKRDGHPAVPVLMEHASGSVQYGHLLVSGTEADRYRAVVEFIKSRGLENVPGQFMLVRLEEVDVEIIKI